MATTASSSQEVLAAQRRYLWSCVRPLYEHPLVLVEGQGVWVTDAEGRKYLDLFGGVLTTSLGHCHPEVVSRVQEQAARLGHTSTLYVTENQIDVARRLAEMAPGRLSQTFFTNSGTEAVETAIAAARLYTGHTEVIALRHGYSGRSALAAAVTAQGPWRPLPSSTAGIVHAAAPYAYRCAAGHVSPQEAEDYAIRDLEEVIHTTTNGKPAAFLAETIAGVGGFIVPPAGYFRRAAELIHDAGGLFICDEVQTGVGRTGRHWFGIEHWGVTPDIITMAKGIANGYPVGATITTPEIASAWTAKSFSTFGGNPICMAAASATLEVMAREEVPRRAHERGVQLRAGLDALKKNHAWIGDVRGMGLMQALELVNDPVTRQPAPIVAARLLEAAKAEGLLLGLGGLHANVIRIGPPMLITEQELAEGLTQLENACRRL